MTEDYEYDDEGRLTPVSQKELINNSEKRRRMGINGRRLVVSEFSEKIVVSQTLKLYKKVLA